MAFSRPLHLTYNQVCEVLSSFNEDQLIEVVWCYRNKREDMDLERLRSFILKSMEEGHHPGGDIEVKIPALQKKLIGHHDGIYWLEPIA